MFFLRVTLKLTKNENIDIVTLSKTTKKKFILEFSLLTKGHLIKSITKTIAKTIVKELRAVFR